MGVRLGLVGKPDSYAQDRVPARKLECNFVTREVRETPLLRQQKMTLTMFATDNSAIVTPAADVRNPF